MLSAKPVMKALEMGRRAAPLGRARRAFGPLHWGTLALVAVAPLLGGCPDPDGEFAAFNERYPKDTTTTSTNVGGNAPCGSAPSQEIEGDFLLTLSAKLSKFKPIVFSAKLASTEAGFTMTVVPLQIDRKTPTSESYDLGPFPIADDGKFHAALPELVVDGTANPITKGSGITATATLDGWVCADFMCGDVTGKATTESGLNVNLDGSTFTIDRANEDGSYVEPPLINCAGDLAKPASEI